MTAVRDAAVRVIRDPTIPIYRDVAYQSIENIEAPDPSTLVARAEPDQQPNGERDEPEGRGWADLVECARVERRDRFGADQRL
ncbi:MAG TPA: hypothetical protein VFC51_09220 [Chloroflexota bacterium]|nr:hypothetical protein [Chloroflexota bacterium]